MRVEEASGIFAAMGQPHRLSILQCLAPYSRGETARGLPAGEIARRLELAPATLSFHLKEMTGKGLLMQKRDGRRIFYRVNIPRLLEALEYVVTHICECPAGEAT